MASLFFGKSQAVVEAEIALRQKEDDLMHPDPREGEDLAVHSYMDSQRLGVVLGRIRLMQMQWEQTANRNLMATLCSAGALFLVLRGTDLFSTIWQIFKAIAL
ncbi:MAG TPA: hypothetical protein VMT89_01950 [Candidatus Acidoferrales bacterium]|nr:hypothetical protein [Candidatus Acidoferrales bacterium]